MNADVLAGIAKPARASVSIRKKFSRLEREVPYHPIGNVTPPASDCTRPGVISAPNKAKKIRKAIFLPFTQHFAIYTTFMYLL